MKKTGIVMGALILMFVAIFTTNGFAQEEASQSEDYFADNWEVILMDTPSGDYTMIVQLTREDGELKGIITSEDAPEEFLIENIVEREDSITFYWTAQGTYANVDLKKEDENNMKGTLMGMFPATAERVVE